METSETCRVDGVEVDAMLSTTRLSGQPSARLWARSGSEMDGLALEMELRLGRGSEVYSLTSHLSGVYWRPPLTEISACLFSSVFTGR